MTDTITTGAHVTRREAAAEANGDAPVRKVKVGAVARSFIGRLVSPRHVIQAVKLHRGRKAARRSFDNAQLALYTRILPSDFLHFGYFDDPSVKPEDMSLSDVARAQNRYAELLLDLAGNPADPVLDVGCGMGGLSRMLRDRGFTPVALTPDRLQASHVQSTLPGVEVIRCKLEQLAADEHAHRFGTIFTSESLQYLKLDQALPVLARVLRPGGKWVACDYFHSRPSSDRSFHEWDAFVARLPEAGWRITYQRDITAHVMPTLSYIHMWAVRFGLPLMDFIFLRLRRKQPGLHHLLGAGLEQIEQIVASQVGIIDPATFAAGKRYMLMVLERA